MYLSIDILIWCLLLVIHSIKSLKTSSCRLCSYQHIPSTFLLVSPMFRPLSLLVRMIGAQAAFAMFHFFFKWLKTDIVSKADVSVHFHRCLLLAIWFLGLLQSYIRASVVGHIRGGYVAILGLTKVFIKIPTWLKLVSLES